MTFENIKSNYDKGYWSKQQVGVCVKANLITKEQYKTIVGETYKA